MKEPTDNPIRPSRPGHLGHWSRVVSLMLLLINGCAVDEPRTTPQSIPTDPVRSVPDHSIQPTPPATLPLTPEATDASEPRAVVKSERPIPIPPKPLPAAPDVEPSVAIRIDTLPPSHIITLHHASGRLCIGTTDLGSLDSEQTHATPIEIRLQRGMWSVTPRAGTTLELTAGELLVRAPPGTEQSIRWEEKEWPGRMRIVAAATSIDLVMDVPLETYLPGVIAKELYGSWCAAAYEAQAIAARSFAVVEEARWDGRRHYDMVAGQQSQAWIGATDNARALAAVRQTRGILLMHDGTVVPAYYSSACGGRPASALGVLTDNPHHDIPPVSAGTGLARSACCQLTRVATWNASIPLVAVELRVRAWANSNGRPDLAALGKTASIEVTEKNAAGRPTTIRLKDRTGVAAKIAAEDFRRAINAPGDPKSSMRSSDCTIRLTASTAEFSGRGFGHGVGLCQHGAQEMGRAGRTSTEILALYYPTAVLVKAWE